MKNNKRKYAVDRLNNITLYCRKHKDFGKLFLVMFKLRNAKKYRHPTIVSELNDDCN